MTRLSTLFVCGLALFAPRPATAIPIFGSFSGAITSVNPALTSQFAVGQSFSGEFSYDTDAPDLQPGPIFALYHILTFSAAVNGYAATGGNSFIDIENGSGGSDFLDVFDLNPTGAPVGGFNLSMFAIDLSDFSGTALPSDALPQTLDLVAFNSHTFGLQFFNASMGTVSVSGNIASLTLSTEPGPTVVPEPSTGLLLAAALAALARWRRTERRCPPL